jgi:hypothetical protein
VRVQRGASIGEFPILFEFFLADGPIGLLQKEKEKVLSTLMNN